jgi:ABC-2 type transport system ATP-binding protein
MESPTVPPSQEPLLTMENASLDFGEGAGVFDLNLTLSKGAILGMIGPSGCGKTTTIRLVNGVSRTTSGSVRVFGKAPPNFSRADKAQIGYIPQHFILYNNLSVEENMHFIGGIYGMPHGERATKMMPLLDFVNLKALVTS